MKLKKYTEFIKEDLYIKGDKSEEQKKAFFESTAKDYDMSIDKVEEFYNKYYGSGSFYEELENYIKSDEYLNESLSKEDDRDSVIYDAFKDAKSLGSEKEELVELVNKLVNMKNKSNLNYLEVLQEIEVTLPDSLLAEFEKIQNAISEEKKGRDLNRILENLRNMHGFYEKLLTIILIDYLPSRSANYNQRQGRNLKPASGKHFKKNMKSI